MTAKKANFDTLRSLAFGSISGTYAALGAEFTENARIITLINNTEGDMIISTDNTVSAGELFLPSGATQTFDFTANLVPGKDDGFVMAIGTQFYVKQSTAPVSGAVYLEVVYA